MKIVVTGGTGRIGRWIVRELVDGRGGRIAHAVTVFDRKPGRVPRGVRIVAGDHEDFAAVSGVVAGADAVLHLSAADHGQKPADIFHGNVLGTFHVHEAARIHGVRRVVHWSSVAALGWSGRNGDFLPDYLPIDEDHPLRARDAYGLSKAVGEDIARSFSEKFGLETIALRHVWTTKPADRIQLWRNGGKRHGRWIHYAYLDVRDAVVAARRALEVDAVGHTALYVAADDSCAPAPLPELLPRLRPAIGDLAAHLTATQSAISNARAKALLGWQPRHTWRTPPSLATRVHVRTHHLASCAANRLPPALVAKIRKAIGAGDCAYRKPNSARDSTTL